MSHFKNLVLTTSLLAIIALLGSVSSEAAPQKTKRAKVSRKLSPRSSLVGDAMRPKKSLSFDGRTIEALTPGKYDSLTHLSDADGKNGNRHLYDLPKDFASRTADAQSELRYQP